MRPRDTRTSRLAAVAGLLAPAVALAVLTACATNHGTGSSQVRAEAERVEPEADAPVEELVEGINNTAFSLQRGAPGEVDENFVVGPASVIVAFAMAAAAADDETRSNLEQSLGLPSEPGLHEAANSLIRAFESADGHEDIELSVANSGWSQDGSEVTEEFLEVLAEHYDAGQHETDLQGDPSASADAINDWVADATRDRITELIGPDQLGPDAVYVLVNAMYMDAKWENEFSADRTRPAPFRLADGDETEVEMMSEPEMETRYTQQDKLVAVELPYRGGDLAMVVVVPEDLTEFEEDLDAESWSELTGELTEGTVLVELPKWEHTTELDLAEPLGAMGVEIPGGSYPGIAPGAFLDSAVHVADIRVDEEGTEAAAATGMGFAVSAPIVDAEIVADRPFFYAIHHTETGAVLFSGRVADPTQ